MNQPFTAGELSRQKRPADYLLFRWLKKSTVTEIIAFLYIILLLYAGGSKLMEYTVFQVQLSESPLLGPVAGIVAWAVPLAEFIVSILLFFPRTRLAGFYLALALMIAFTVYIILILTAFKDVPCSCGGVLEQLSWTDHLLLNAAFIALAGIGIRLQRQLHLS